MKAEISSTRHTPPPQLMRIVTNNPLTFSSHQSRSINKLYKTPCKSLQKSKGICGTNGPFELMGREGE